MKQFVTLLTLCAILSVGCKRKYDCRGVGFYYSFTGFDSTDLGEVIVKHYEKGGGFKTVLFKTNASIYSADCSNPAKVSLGCIGITGKYDEEIVMPRITGRIYRIQDITIGNERGASDGTVSEIDIECIVSASYRLDGQQHDYPAIYNKPNAYYKSYPVVISK